MPSYASLPLAKLLRHKFQNFHIKFVITLLIQKKIIKFNFLLEKEKKFEINMRIYNLMM